MTGVSKGCGTWLRTRSGSKSTNALSCGLKSFDLSDVFFGQFKRRDLPRAKHCEHFGCGTQNYTAHLRELVPVAEGSEGTGR